MFLMRSTTLNDTSQFSIYFLTIRRHMSHLLNSNDICLIFSILLDDTLLNYLYILFYFEANLTEILFSTKPISMLCHPIYLFTTV
jgi:hypothetical protein